MSIMVILRGAHIENPAPRRQPVEAKARKRQRLDHGSSQRVGNGGDQALGYSFIYVYMRFPWPLIRRSSQFLKS